MLSFLFALFSFNSAVAASIAPANQVFLCAKALIPRDKMSLSARVFAHDKERDIILLLPEEVNESQKSIYYILTKDGAFTFEAKPHQFDGIYFRVSGVPHFDRPLQMKIQTGTMMVNRLPYINTVRSGNEINTKLSNPIFPAKPADTGGKRVIHAAMEKVYGDYFNVNSNLHKTVATECGPLLQPEQPTCGPGVVCTSGVAPKHVAPAADGKESVNVAPPSAVRTAH